MKIVIPMAGRGERFKKMGYSTPKPLIPIDGKPMIGHVVSMYGEDDDFVFVCNNEHLENSDLGEVLQQLSADARVIGIENHELGPVYSTTFAFGDIGDGEPAIVSYCDFSVRWDYGDFKKTVRASGCDGCITAYRGFHPHSLGTTMYAYLKLDANGNVADVREKEPFTDNRMGEYASAGSYYFSKGLYVKKYFTELIEKKLDKNGEYYASLAYRLMARDHLRITAYPIEKFLQWGTPEDLEDYLGWSGYFANYHASPQPKSNFNQTNLVPAAGIGARFREAGFTVPKPLIPVGGKPMILVSAESAPQPALWVFVCQKEHVGPFGLQRTLEEAYPGCRIIPVEKPTQGQASTCLLAKGEIQPDSPLLILACDSKIVWDAEKFRRLVSSLDLDAAVFTFRKSRLAALKPWMYGWVEIGEGGRAMRVSCKKPISETPINDHAVVGSFYFKSAGSFFWAVESMIRKGRMVNGEYYVDECMNELIEAGKIVRVFEVEKCISFGTPNELNTYLYWLDYFANGGQGTAQSQHHSSK